MKSLFSRVSMAYFTLLQGLKANTDANILSIQTNGAVLNRLTAIEQRLANLERLQTSTAVQPCSTYLN